MEYSTVQDPDESVQPSLETSDTSVSQARKAPTKPRARNRRSKNEDNEAEDSNKRRCVSTACIACRKRKSKCDGQTPACAACSQVYGTECIYDPNSDHRRKGVYKKDTDNLKTRNSTLQTLIQAILNYPEEDVPSLVRDIRTCESLDDVAERIVAKENGTLEEDEDEVDGSPLASIATTPTFETQLSTKMGELRMDDGSVRYIGGTSNLIFLGQEDGVGISQADSYQQQEDPITSWTNVTSDPELVVHLLNMYFTWHYTYFTCLPKSLFYRDFLLGKPPADTRRKTEYCTPLLVNAILALGCHFTSNPGARENPEDSATAGDHFFKEAKRLIMENDEHERPKITTVQALALMSVREAGCGREAKGWVYSGMSFRMACDLGLNLDSGGLSGNRESSLDESEEDPRRITFWGCFLFDKCWSNYLGRLPQLPTTLITVPKFEVFPDEDSSNWSPYTDSGFSSAHVQPARTRAVALQIASLCEISSDLMRFFYNPSDIDKTKGKQAELKKLSEIHTRLETWRRNLPKEFEPKEGCLSNVLIMHMFFQLLFIHLFRPFLKYNQATSPLPATVSPRKLCTQAAAMISKLLRLYKRSHGLRQICNICVYIAHSACTIHLLNLPDKNARRDIIHGVKHLEEIAEGWLCARRTLGILSVLARKWKVKLPEEAEVVLARTDSKFDNYLKDVSSPIANQPQQSTSPFYQPPAQYANPTTAAWPQQRAMVAQPQANYYSGPPTQHTRNESITYTQLPPQSATELRPAAYPSNATTPSSIRPKQHSVDSGNTPSMAAGASPSDMFGGVESLLKDSQDWVFQDQAQLAVGFDNWNALTGQEDWMESRPSPTGGPYAANPAASAPPANNAQVNGYPAGYTNVGMAGMGGVNTGINGYANLTNYNENEWYQ
ncbi:Nitrogen assimilation transcription factor nit-4 [Zalaria obscura]|uniref:Nitrogen assimilation transcription factor nit-4 n=1 Tax=Zalaria obscura TaxID=2024903 RepID=A0ACC3SLR2_9PEZI